MNFEINKGATLPILRLELIQDGRNGFNSFFEMIQNSDIYFCMADAITGNKKIGKKKARCEIVTPESCIGEQYYITYQFTEKETSVEGRYIGKFIIDFLDDSGTLIVPIREPLYINVLDQGIKK